MLFINLIQCFIKFFLGTCLLVSNDNFLLFFLRVHHSSTLFHKPFQFQAYILRWLVRLTFLCLGQLQQTELAKISVGTQLFRQYTEIYISDNKFVVVFSSHTLCCLSLHYLQIIIYINVLIIRLTGNMFLA